MTHPLTWIDIDLDKLVQNYQTACSLTSAQVTCVLKANAYGHGLRMTAKALQAAGCRSFAVSCTREALALRQAGIEGSLLVMTPALTADLPALIRLGITLTTVSPEGLHDIGQAAGALGIRAQTDIKVDTGFHRLGIAPTLEAAADMAKVYRQHAQHLTPVGVYSHLGLINPQRDSHQAEALCRMRDLLTKEGVPIREMHLCDSIGLVRYPAYHFDRVRVGAMLYGVRPARSEHLPFPCLETLSFHATVTQVHPVPAGEPVGYGEDPLPRNTRIATVSAGYGDGYPRRLSHGKGKVLLHGQLCPVVGLICMDQMMVDVTDVPDVQPGDDVTLLGGGIPYMAMEDWGDTNRNECLAQLSSRPLRRYWQQGKPLCIQDDLLSTTL